MRGVFLIDLLIDGKWHVATGNHRDPMEFSSAAEAEAAAKDFVKSWFDPTTVTHFVVRPAFSRVAEVSRAKAAQKRASDKWFEERRAAEARHRDLAEREATREWQKQALAAGWSPPKEP